MSNFWTMKPSRSIAAGMPLILGYFKLDHDPPRITYRRLDGRTTRLMHVFFGPVRSSDLTHDAISQFVLEG